MNWLALIFALELGWASTQIAIDREIEYWNASPYSVLDGAVRIADVVDVGGRVDTSFAHAGGYSFAPIDASYTVYARASFRGITAGFEHTCHHPLISDARPDVALLTGGGNTFFVRYESGR